MLGRGDLSPRRRDRHLGRWLAVLVVLVVVLAGLSYGGYRHFHHSVRVATAASRPCRTVDTAAGPASAGSVRLSVRNGTLRTGLAAKVAHELRTRGFHVTGVGNATRTIAGVATVQYPAGKRREAQAVAAQVSGATLTTGSGGLVLVIGHGYSTLRSLAAATAAERAETPTTTSVCPSGSPTPTTGNTAAAGS